MAAPSEHFRLRNGLDVELDGAPRQEIEAARPVSTVALLPPDHVGLRPRVLVAEGQRVRLGQPLVESRDVPGLVLTAPGSGRVLPLERGARRALRALVVELEAHEEALARLRFDPRRAAPALAARRARQSPPSTPSKGKVMHGRRGAHP